MIVEQSTGATSRETVDWHSIDWKKAHKIVNRLPCRETSDRKPGQEHAGGGQGTMGYPGEKGDGRTRLAVKRLYTPTTATTVPSQTKREATSPRHSHHERPWDASRVPTSTGPSSRNTGGFTFVRVPKGTQLCGRSSSMLQGTLQGRHANMDPGRGH
jgi:hypothetical protein